VQRCRGGLLEIVRDIYLGATSSVSVSDGKTDDIQVLSGIRQGCPLSGLLFILAIDPVISSLQGANADHRVLAFADDLCLLANNAPDLQITIDSAQANLNRLGLSINASKCASLHVSGRTPVGVRDSSFNLQGATLKPLAEGDAASFLGAQVGFNMIPSLATISEIIELGLKIMRSKLAPWQRLGSLKTFFYPAAVHLQRLGTFSKTDWKRVDDIMRPEIKSINSSGGVQRIPIRLHVTGMLWHHTVSRRRRHSSSRQRLQTANLPRQACSQRGD